MLTARKLLSHWIVGVCVCQCVCGKFLVNTLTWFSHRYAAQIKKKLDVFWDLPSHKVRSLSLCIQWPEPNLFLDVPGYRNIERLADGWESGCPCPRCWRRWQSWGACRGCQHQSGGKGGLSGILYHVSSYIDVLNPITASRYCPDCEQYSPDAIKWHSGEIRIDSRSQHATCCFSRAHGRFG